MEKSDYSLVRSAMRRAWLRFPARAEALKQARREYTGDNKRQKWVYLCNYCLTYYKGTEVVVDHIRPCGTFLKPEDWVTFGPGLFCGVDNLQILCKGCHAIKTKEERIKK